MKVLLGAIVAGLLTAGTARAADIDFTTSDFGTTFSGAAASTVNITISGIGFTLVPDARGADGWRQGATGLDFGAGGNGMIGIDITADHDIVYTSFTARDEYAFFNNMTFDGSVAGGTVFTGLGPSSTTTQLLIFDAPILVAAGQVFRIFQTAGTGLDEADLIALSFEKVTTDAAVPLPAGLPLLLAGMGALGIVRRRKG